MRDSTKRQCDRALGVHPSGLLVLDEPTSGLDPVARTEVVRTIAAARAGGMATMLVTHHLDEARLVCDEAVILVGGRLVWEGRPHGCNTTAISHHGGDAFSAHLATFQSAAAAVEGPAVEANAAGRTRYCPMRREAVATAAFAEALCTGLGMETAWELGDLTGFENNFISCVREFSKQS